jgi:type I restriction enzyme S subunit
MTWTDTTWQQVCTLHYGKALNDYKHSEHAYPVWGSGGIVGSTTKPIAPAERPIIARKGTLTAYWSEQPSHVIDTAFWLEPNKNLDSRWSYYAVKDLDISTLSSGSGVPSLSRDDFYRKPLRLPPLIEQKAIAHALGNLDNKIKLNKKINQNLEDTAKAIFKSWFVDFDPVYAKVNGQDTGLPNEIIDLFPSKFEESDTGLIPSSFSIGRLGDFLSIQGGFAFKSENFGDQGYKVIKIKNILSDGGIDLSDCDLVDIQDNRLDKFLLKDGDAILAMTGATIGKVGLVNSVDDLVYLNQRVGKLISKHEVLGQTCWFSYLNLISDDIRKTIEGFAYGSAQPNISSSNIESFKVVVPNVELIKEFNKLVNPIFQKILLNFREINVLAELRNTILPKLISGELKIPNAEKFLEESGI